MGFSAALDATQEHASRLGQPERACVCSVRADTRREPCLDHIETTDILQWNGVVDELERRGATEAALLLGDHATERIVRIHFGACETKGARSLHGREPGSGANEGLFVPRRS